MSDAETLRPTVVNLIARGARDAWYRERLAHPDFRDHDGRH